VADSLRFTEILTTATAVASYLGANEIGAAHVQMAVAVLRENVTLADLGAAPSPLVPRSRSTPVSGPVRELVQRWFADLGSDPLVEIDEEGIEVFLAELGQAVSPS
jgi:hypothetical protein